ncbi:PspC domain-containing protein [Thalassotalea ganghwensis]
MRYHGKYRIERELAKDNVNKKLSGVCSGVAKHYDLSVTGVRIAALVSLFIFPVVTAVSYIIATMVLPSR